jgi:hypothetical protein
LARSRIDRNTQLCQREEVREQLLTHYTAIEKGFNDQVGRADETLDYWDIYNCKLGSKQFYAGNARLFVPLVHNAVEARKTRLMGRLFPEAGRYLDITTEDGDIPHAVVALLELYVEQSELRTQVIPPLLVAGDVEGTYAVCVTWRSREKYVVSRETSPVRVGGIEHPDLEPVERIKSEKITDAYPVVEIIPDPDLLILPATSDSIEEALDAGGSVTTICRWTKERVQEQIDAGEIDAEYSAQMLAAMKRGDAGSSKRDVPKKLAEYAGIKAGGGYAEIYRTWLKIKIGKERRLVLAYFGGDDTILGCKLCPYWCDDPDIIFEPVRKFPGVGKGPSQIKPCADMQYAANDAINEGMDSATYSMLPIVMTDPEKNPKIGTMVMDLMAVWETSPRDTQPIAFPQLYQHAFDIVQAAERYISQTLGVNPAMIAQSTGVPGRKRTQAEVAMEQQVDLMSTDASATVVERVLTKIINKFAHYDAQFRDDEILVRSVGELGVKVEMQTVPPLQMGKRWQFKWRGVEAARTVQQVQQQISALNVITQMAQNPAVQQQGMRVNPVPFIRTLAENAFGPRMAPEIFEDIRDKFTIPAELENMMLDEAQEVPVSPLDDDAMHLQHHLPAAQQAALKTIDIMGVPVQSPVTLAYQRHIQAHQKQLQAKAQAQQMQQMMAQMQQAAGQGGPGQPGGGGRPGPRPGAQNVAPRANLQQPPGRIAPDQMRGGLVQMPRQRIGRA